MFYLLKSGRFLQIKATYYNPIRKKKINIIVKDSYKLIPMSLERFGKCFKLDVNKKLCHMVFTLMKMYLWVLVQSSLPYIYLKMMTNNNV